MNTKMKKLFVCLFIMIVSCGVALARPHNVPQGQDYNRRSFLRGDVLDIDLRDAGKLNEYLGPGEDRRV